MSTKGYEGHRTVDWTKDFELDLFTDSAGNVELSCGVFKQAMNTYALASIEGRVRNH